MVLNHPIRLIPRAVSDTGFHKGAVHLLVDSLISWGGVGTWNQFTLAVRDSFYGRESS